MRLQRASLLVSGVEKLVRQYGDRWQVVDYDTRALSDAASGAASTLVNCCLVNKNMSRSRCIQCNSLIDNKFQKPQIRYTPV